MYSIKDKVSEKLSRLFFDSSNKNAAASPSPSLDGTDSNQSKVISLNLPLSRATTTAILIIVISGSCHVMWFVSTSLRCAQSGFSFYLSWVFSVDLISSLFLLCFCLLKLALLIHLEFSSADWLVSYITRISWKKVCLKLRCSILGCGASSEGEDPDSDYGVV